MSAWGELAQRLADLERALTKRGPDLALFLVYDRPNRVIERPALERSYFAQRCISDRQIDQTIEAFRSIGAYVELFEDERPLVDALANGRLHSINRDLMLVFNGLSGGITPGGFEPGRKALIPCLADTYDLVSANSNAYACALGRHKFHYLTVLRALGVRTPKVWHYRPTNGWSGGLAPPDGTKVIAKSTYESWSIGVKEDSVFLVDASCDDRVSAICEEIAQPVTVQEFVPGSEVCVPILSCPARVVTPPVEAILAKAPGDPEAVMTIGDNLTDAAVRYNLYAGPSQAMEQLRTRALAAFDVLQLQSFARIDFRVDDRGEAWVIDVGVSPGMSTESSAFHSFAELGLSHPSFLRVVIAASLASRGLLR